MKNLENAVYFRTSANSFMLEENLRMWFDQTVFEPLGYKKYDILLDDFLNGKEITIRYSLHHDGSEPYKNFSIHFEAKNNLIIGKRI